MYEFSTNNRPHEDNVAKPARIKLPENPESSQEELSESETKEALLEAQNTIKHMRKVTWATTSIVAAASIFSAIVMLTNAKDIINYQKKNAALVDKLNKEIKEKNELGKAVDRCNDTNYQQGVAIEDVNTFIEKLNKCQKLRTLRGKGICFQNEMHAESQRRKEHVRQKRGRR